ncbi:hypothetical protein C1H46_041147 [Malus baccata]|uniref:Uncharacterized protein n=1 Tax=Malus baccata TaxID=106549 RepID=A0A540KGG0_MALBA|nr:hypothetical protein C1H46_041147 [Malus baccata]
MLFLDLSLWSPMLVARLFGCVQTGSHVWMLQSVRRRLVGGEGFGCSATGAAVKA